MKVECVGGQGEGLIDPMLFELQILKDMPDGVPPVIIRDDTRDLSEFELAVKKVEMDSQVLILLDKLFLGKKNCQMLTSRLPVGSYVEHHMLKKDREGASKWVENLEIANTFNQQNSGNTVEKKYLIGDWYSSAGYEVPSVIFVTRDPDCKRNPTFCQRAKAKLIIYHVSNL